MPDPSMAPSRGNPPNRDLLNQRLGDRFPLWNEVRETVSEIGATWKWMHSEATNAWSYRSYLAGERFFVSLTLNEEGFEVSLNLLAEELAAIVPSSPAEETQLARLTEKGVVDRENPVWVHHSVTSPSDLPLLAKILVIRARRIQKPRLKPGKQRK